MKESNLIALGVILLLKKEQPIQKLNAMRESHLKRIEKLPKHQNHEK